MGKIIAAPSGTGKTYFVKHTLNWIDLDSYVFEGFINSIKGREKIAELLNWFDYNIITNNVSALKNPDVKNNVAYVILPSDEMKIEILERVSKRDLDNKESTDWSILYKNDYEKLIMRFKYLPFPKIYLKPGQYVSDVIDEKGNAKSGIEVIV